MQLLKISTAKDYLLIPDFIWDGKSPSLTPGQAVCITKGRISGVIPTPAPGSDDSAIEAIRLPGLTLMPGLADCHVHLSMNSENLFQAIDDWENRPEVVEDQVRKAAADYLSNGVLAIRDGSDRCNIGLKARQDINLRAFPGPLVISTGRAVFKKGKYGSFLGPGAATVEEALKQTAEFYSEGIDQLKVVVSGLVSFKDFGHVGPVQFTTEELCQISGRAHSLGLKVMAHASSAAAVETAVLAGVDSVEHGYFLETRQLQLMAERGTAWVPTLAPLGNLLAGGFLPYEGANLETIRHSFELQLSRIKEAHDLGVLLGIGTDAGANQVRHGYSYHDELKFFSWTGLNNHSILRTATSASAGILGLRDYSSTISAGLKPYLIGVRGNPLESLEVLKKPELIIMPG